MNERRDSHVRAPDPEPRLDALDRLLDRPLSVADLSWGAEWAARPVEERGGPASGILLFQLADEIAALPAARLRRVTVWTRAVPIPYRTGGVFRGVCNVRGELVLCADLHRLLGIPVRAGQHSTGEGAADLRRMVGIGPAGAPWVFEVDAVLGVERIEASSIRPVPVTVEYLLSSYASGVAQNRGRSVTILDADRVLAGFQGGLA